MSDNPKNLAEDLDPHSWRVLSEAIRGLETAWRQQSSPDLAEYLIAHPDWLRLCILKELIKVDQEYAWQNGIRRFLEEYLSHWPEVGESDSMCMELLRAECLTRIVFDEAPSLSDIRTRFPELADDLNLSEIARQAESEGLTTGTNLSETPNQSSYSTPAIASLNQEAAESDERIGTSLGRYEIRDRLAHGGMGIVYRAWDSQLAREVALKIPKFDPETEPDIAGRFLQEAQTAAGIRHRSICSVHDYGVTERTPFFVMPLVKGRSLESMIRKGPLSSRKVAEIASKLARALDCIHETGLMHRDVSASNVIIDEEQEPVLMDFGLARGADVRDGEVLCSGTPAYMAPETLSVEGRIIDLRADIFSLGVLCYQMLTGQLPQSAKTKLSDGYTPKNITPPSVANPDVDKRIEAVCLRAMASHPAKRYQSAAELADAFDEYLKESKNSTWYQTRWKAVSSLGIAGAGVILAWQTGWFDGTSELNTVDTNLSNSSVPQPSARVPDFPREAVAEADQRAQSEANLNRIQMEIEAPPNLSKDPWDSRNIELRRYLISELRQEIPSDLAIEAASMLAGISWPTVAESQSFDPESIYWNRMPRADEPSVSIDPGPRPITDTHFDTIQHVQLVPGGSFVVKGRIEPHSPSSSFLIGFEEPRPFNIRIISLTHGFQTKIVDRWIVAGTEISNSEATDEHGHRLHMGTDVSLHEENKHFIQVERGKDNPLEAEGDYLLLIWQPDS